MRLTSTNKEESLKAGVEAKRVSNFNASTLGALTNLFFAVLYFLSVSSV